MQEIIPDKKKPMLLGVYISTHHAYTPGGMCDNLMHAHQMLMHTHLGMLHDAFGACTPFRFLKVNVKF